MQSLQELNDLLKPQWGAEKWILEGWQHLNTEEKQSISLRIDALFKNGLPFEMKFDKILYIYCFSLLAQLEVLAIQIPIKVKNKIFHPELKKKMHQQLLDEIFHGIVFTKIVYLLSAPFAYPPEYNQSTEKLCNFVREEESPLVAVVLLNLICEGWIEELFKFMQQNDVAPKVFEAICEDETRHVKEADLYCDIGIPDKDTMLERVRVLERMLFSSVFSQREYMFFMLNLSEGNLAIFIENLRVKHAYQLKKVGLTPGIKWECSMQIFLQKMRVAQRFPDKKEIEISPIRSIMLHNFSQPDDPVIVAEFDLNISALDYFNHTTRGQLILTPLILQSISAAIAGQDRFRDYYHNGRLYRSQQAYLSLAIKLPGCDEHISSVIFENCHQYTVYELLYKIKMARDIQVYCYQKRQEIEKIHPNLKYKWASTSADVMKIFRLNYAPDAALVGLSNVVESGFSRGKVALLPSETMRFLMLKMTRKHIWNESTHAFEDQDVLPLSLSADHRLFDGNIPVPLLIDNAFQESFRQFSQNEQNNRTLMVKNYKTCLNKILYALDMMAVTDMKMAHAMMTLYQSIWHDSIPCTEMFPKIAAILEQCG
jgi:hypothetical protein